MSLIGADAGELAGVAPPRCASDGVDQGLRLIAFDMLVDFSVPAATLDALAICRAAGKSMVIGTTGIDAAGREAD